MLTKLPQVHLAHFSRPFAQTGKGKEEKEEKGKKKKKGRRKEERGKREEERGTDF